MQLQRVTDKGSNAIENIERAVDVIGRSRIKRAVFVAVHSGRKQTKSVDDIAAETGEGRQQVLNAANRLAQQGLIHSEKQSRMMIYRRDPFYQANRAAVLRYLDNPKALRQLPTKRRPINSSILTVLRVPVQRRLIRAKSVTIDEIQSFAKVRGAVAAGRVKLGESLIKKGLLRVIGERGQFKDWGGERNDFLTSRLIIHGQRRTAAFALKGPAKTGILTPGKMGKNGDQIQRLARSPAEVLVIQYHGQVSDEVREQLETFAQLKSFLEQRTIWYCIIDGDDTSRLVQSYSTQFNS